MLAARRSLAVVVSVRVNRRGEGRAATGLNVRMTSVGARRCGQNGARCARRHDRCALDKVGGADKERRARGSALARRRRVSSSEQARRGQSSNGAEREDDVGRRSQGHATAGHGDVRPVADRATGHAPPTDAVARRTVRFGEDNAERRGDDGGDTAGRPTGLTNVPAGAKHAKAAHGGARPTTGDDVRRCGESAVERRAAQRAERFETEREERGSGGDRRPAVRQPGAARTAHAAHDDTIGARSTRSAALTSNDVLAARRSLAVVVSVRVNRRGEGRAATELNVRMTSVGARRCGQNGARCARRHDRCALDEVGGADKERRARGSALARRRRVSSSEQARRGQSSNGAEREDDVGRRSAVRPGRRTLRATTRSVRARQGRRR